MTKRKTKDSEQKKKAGVLYTYPVINLIMNAILRWLGQSEICELTHASKLFTTSRNKFHTMCNQQKLL
jgi:hypothetical protein